MTTQNSQDQFTNETIDTTNRVVLIVTNDTDAARAAVAAAGLEVADWAWYRDSYDYSSSAAGTWLEGAEASSFFFF